MIWWAIVELAVLAEQRIVESGDPSLASFCDHHGVGRQVAVDHFMAVCIIKSREEVSYDLEFLVEGERQAGLCKVQTESLYRKILCDQTHQIFSSLTKRSLTARMFACVGICATAL